MNFMKKALITVPLLVAIGCSSGPRPNNISMDTTYQDGKNKVVKYETKMVGESTKDALRTSDELYLQFMAWNNKEMPEDVIGSYLKGMHGYATRLNNLYREAEGLPDNDYKDELLDKIEATSKSLTRALKELSGRTNINKADLSLPGRNVKMDGSGDQDPAIRVMQDALNYFDATNPDAAKIYRAHVRAMFKETEDKYAANIGKIEKGIKDASPMPTLHESESKPNITPLPSNDKKE